ncbi:MAG: radical SAM protein [Bacillota bacterium]|nr:radical SAM protein [Bacillota bacterium]
MKITFINPPFLDKYSRSSRSPAVTKSGTIYFPLWLSYAAGVAEEAGFEVNITDAPAECINTDQTIEKIKKYAPQLVVCDTSTPSIHSDIEFCKALKSSLPNVFVCLVGTHASIFDEDILSKYEFIDAVARHEYDYTVRELAEYINSAKELDEVKGITFRKNTEIIKNPDRPYIENLDELPFVSKVYHDHLDIKNYFYAHVAFPTISIFSSRGCPSKCFFCIYSQVMFGKRFRRRSAQNLFNEILYIEKTFPEVKEILIDDDNFTVDQQNVKQFCELMIQHKSRLKWIVQSRVNLKFDTMKLMKAAGCKLLVAGFESGNQQILDNMHKGITLAQSVEFDSNAKKAGLRVHGCFMAGNPGETKETLMQTLEFAKKLHLDTVQFFPLMLYPGTEAYDWAEQNNYITTKDFSEWLTDEGLHNCVFATENLTSQELVNFCDYARKKFYLRPKYMAYKALQSVTSKDDFLRTLKSMNTFRKYLFRKEK